MSRIRSIAVILHVWQTALVVELAGALARIPSGLEVDVYVSVPEEAASAGGLAPLRALLGEARFVVCENRGADIGGLFAVLRDPGFRSGYDAWCKLHTKRGGNTAPGSGEAWRKSLLLDILGTTSVAAACLDAIQNRGAGVVGSRRCVLGSPLDPRAARLLRLPAPPWVRFVAGTMFWASGGVLEALLRSELTQAHFEPGFAHEGRLEHAVERAFGCFPVWGSRLAFPTQSAADEYEALGAALPFEAVDVGPGRTIETYTFPGEVRLGAFA